MKIVLLVFIFFFIAKDPACQTRISDTLPVTVDLSRFIPNKKIVKVEYGKVIMYCNQADYLGKEAEQDTVRITPKYLNDDIIADLLEKGRVRVWRRSTENFEDSIRHQLKQVVSMASRWFKFNDGTNFFSQLEIIGIYGAISFDTRHRSKNKKKKKIIQVKEFEYEEEFADTKDTMRIKTRDYFPVLPSQYYIYDPNNGYGETDTNQCRTIVLQGKEIFYFAECYSPNEIISIGTEMFGSGIYFYRNDSLFTIDADYEQDIYEKDLSDAAILLPAYIKPGDSLTVANNNWKSWKREVLTYLRHEDIIVKDRSYQDCIKIKILTYYDDSIYLEYIWLKKNVGLIKWMRATGRIDELIGFFTIDPVK